MTSQRNSYLVVIAGGSGTRFWPKSTAKKPKQLLHFGNNKTLLEQTLARFDSLVPEEKRMIVTTEALKPAIEELQTGANILAEPQGRNTAPCIYWAARHIAAIDPRAVMLVMPSDHFVAQPQTFRKVVEEAQAWAESHDDLVTLGIKPTRPETGYGYLQIKDEGEPVHRVKAFIEKPDLKRAFEFLSSGHYLWNSGMFVWRADVILSAFDKCMPDYSKVWSNAGGDPEVAYPHMEATSIDYGVMEKSTNVVAFELDCGWDDVGSWPSLETLAPHLNTKQGANVLNAGELLALDSSHNIIDAPGKFVATLGVDNLIVVHSGDKILIARKDRAQDMRKLVEAVREQRPDLV